MTNNTQLYHRLLKYSIPDWKMLAPAFLGMMVMAVTLSMLPALMMQLIDSVLIFKTQTQINVISQAIFTLLMIYGVANYIGNSALNVAANKLGRNLRLAIFNKMLSLPESFYSGLTEKNLNTRFITHLNTISHTGINVISILIKDSLTAIGLLAWMFYLNWELALLVLLITSAIILITQLINGYLRKLSQKTFQATKEATNVAFDLITNRQMIKSYGGQLHESERFKDKANQMYFANIKLAKVKALGIALVPTIIAISLMAIAQLVMHQPYRSEITPGEISSLIIAALMLVLMLRRISNINHYLLQGKQALENIFLLLDQETEADTGTITNKRCQGGLVFDNVSFSYNKQMQPALINACLTIKPGEIVALSGMTENDRSLFIDLMLRFSHPTQGRILIDDNDLESFKLTGLHENIALISQKALLFDDTAAINIAYGAMKCANEAKITAAAQAAHAIEFIREMPEGLQTVIGSHGIKLTKTQCRHIEIARALLKDPPILILNEMPVTSNAKTDNDLQEGLNTLIQGRTTLILTQQPPTLEKVDRIFMLRNGYISET